MPKVSFVMPNRDKAIYLSESIKTLLNQTIEDIELIIVDDASTDDSRDVIDTFANKDKRIVRKYLKPVLLPIAHRIDRARNIGNQLAKADLICVCDSDDWYVSNRAELSYKTLERRKDCGLFYAHSLLRNRYGDIKNGVSPVELILPFSRRRLWETGKFFISHPTVCYRKEFILKYPYDTEGGVGDWGMFYNLLINHNVKPCFSRKIVHVYRIYAATNRHIQDRLERNYEFEDYLLDKKRKKMDRDKILGNV